MFIKKGHNHYKRRNFLHKIQSKDIIVNFLNKFIIIFLIYNFFFIMRVKTYFEEKIKVYNFICKQKCVFCFILMQLTVDGDQVFWSEIDL